MTESAAFSNLARQKCMKDLDVEQFEVIETLDSHACGLCAEMGGKHYPMSEYVIGITAPPFHPLCSGCTCPYFDDEFTQGDERAARGGDGKTYYVPADMSYKKWKDAFVDGSGNEIVLPKEAEYLVRSHASGRSMAKERMVVNEALGAVPEKVRRQLITVQ